MMNEQTISVVTAVHISVKAVQYNPDKDEIEKLGWPSWVRPGYVRKISTLPIAAYIHERVIRGDPDVEVARLIKENGYYGAMPVSKLKKIVSHYKASIPKIVMLARMNPLAAAPIIKKVRAQVDTLDLMSWAIDLQKKRIEQYRKVEEMSPIPIPEARKELETFFSMVQKYDTAVKDGGFKEEASEVVSQGIEYDMDRVYAREGVNKVMSNPRSRFKVVQAVERIVDLIKDKEALEASSEAVVEDATEEVNLSGIQTKFEAESDEVLDGDYE